MTRQILFRCKTPIGSVQIKNLTSEDKVLDLKAALSTATGIANLKLMGGYPPKELDLSDETLLGNFFKTSKETLTIVESKSSKIKDINTDPDIEVIDIINSPSLSAKVSSNGHSKKSLTRKIVPANNSCLFTAVYFCISNGKYNPEIGSELRKIIVTNVKNNSVQFNDAILGCSNEEYCNKIVKSDVWGGSIELKILSDYYAIEIVAVDIQNLRLNKFGEDKNYSSRIFLIYDGIHYDALYMDTPEKSVTIFSTKDQEYLDLALDVAKEAKSKRQFTDVKRMTVKCLACNEAFATTSEANEHAKKTGHINFGEF